MAFKVFFSSLQIRVGTGTGGFLPPAALATGIVFDGKNLVFGNNGAALAITGEARLHSEDTADDIKQRVLADYIAAFKRQTGHDGTFTAVWLDTDL